MSSGPNPTPVSKSSVAECPSCAEDVRVSNPKIGQHVNCPNCKLQWEVIWLDPVELDWPYLEDDGDDYYDYDDSDDDSDNYADNDYDDD